MKKVCILLTIALLACRAEPEETGQPQDFGRMQLLLRRGGPTAG
ncbi:MAG TPA: hypothetical protein VGR02_11760 [Thermoanaerobaculia bacterium]|nr:hypothetical protein [Thermoanaerobaculia bacterium]